MKWWRGDPPRHLPMHEFLDGLHEDLVRKAMDRWLPRYGPKGSGKSNDAYWDAKWVDPDFTVEEGYSWTAQDHLAKSKEAPEGAARVLDEPIRGLMSFDAMTAQNKELYRAATVVRERKQFHQVLGVSLKRFPRAFLEDFCDVAVHSTTRGRNELVAIGNLETNELYVDRKGRVTPRSTPMDRFDTPKMPPKEKQAYDKLRGEFVEQHQDSEGYSMRKTIRREMRARLQPVLKRHDVLEAQDV